MKTAFAGLVLVLGLALLSGCGGQKSAAPTAKANDPVPVTPKTETPQKAEEGSTAETNAHVEEEADAVAYAISANDDSVITFTGYKPLGSQVGGFAEFSGSITVPGDDLSQLQVDASIDVTSFYTVEPGLKTVLAGENFFNVSTHTTARFTSTGVEKTGDDTYNVSGNFELIGVTKNITLPATIKKSANGLSIVAEFKIDRADWGMNKSWQDQVIHDEVLINLELLATPAE